MTTDRKSCHPKKWSLSPLSIAALVLVGLLSGCGFALRGTTTLPPALQPLHFETVDSNSPIGRAVLRVLTDNKVVLANEPAAEGYRLGIGNESSSERAISVNANARAGEYELTMAVQYQLRQGANIVIAPQALTLSKVYLADPENAVAKNEEAELIRSEMRKELAQQILRRLQAFKP
jgi:LPS-assembly lipoprotein